MDDLSVEVGHPNGAYYKVRIKLGKSVLFCLKKKISFRHPCMILMIQVLMLNMIKSKFMK